MTPLVALAVLTGVLGLVLGSFLNVVIHRLPRHESLVTPRSHCTSCGTTIKGRHNIPVLSWVFLRGRCAYCRAPISARYPLVELGTGGLFAAVTLHFGMSAELPAYPYLIAVGVTLALIDLDLRMLPDSIVLPSYVVSVLLLLPAGAAHSDWWTAGRALLGLSALAAIAFALALAQPNVLGVGDVKLAGIVGLYLGWLSWSALLLGAVGTLLLAALAGALLRPRRALPLPLGPFLVSAAVLALFLAAPVSSWYAALLPA